ncbi:hypothetical protein BLNAU_2797 [Blattamonas nauphoetae]|uniref:Uncharacterized protein n=1 Tax=Blattamonas nauphoetae TaxID=2049346 RepID=A0ABQ9YEG6_9EUKA|nr:hypothetical protein BLNAU_2797 [Blattamonas nauphoetae]
MHKHELTRIVSRAGENADYRTQIKNISESIRKEESPQQDFVINLIIQCAQHISFKSQSFAALVYALNDFGTDFEREQYISIIEEYSVFNRLPKEFQDSFTPEHQLMIDELAIPMQSIVVLDPQEPAEIDVSLRILQAFLETNPNLPITPSPALAKFPQSEIPSIINCCSQCTTPLPCAPFRLTSLSLVPEGIKGCKTLAEKLVSEYTLEILASFHDSPENCANHIALLSPHVSSLSAFIGPFSPPNTIPEQSISAVIFDAILSSFLSPTYRALSVSHHLFSSAPELYTISVLSRWVKTETKIHTCVAVALFGCGNSVRWMDPFSKDAIIRWSAHHISQYNWQFAYQVWAKFISLPLSNPRRIFIESFFGACLNLCEVKSLKTAVPESLSVLLPTVFSFTPLMDHLKQLEDNKSSTNDISSDEPEQTDTSDEDPITKEKHSVEDAASTEKPTASEEQAEQVSQENTSQFLSSFIHIHSKVIKEILPSLATHFSTTTTPASKDAFATTFSSFPSFTSLASTEQKPLSIVLVFAALFEAGSLSVSHFLHHLRLSYSPIISIMDECTSVSPVHPHFIVLRLLCFLWGNSIESIVPIVWELLRLKVVSIPSVLQWVFSDSHSIVPLDSPLASLTTAPSFTEFLRPAVWRVIRQALSLHSTLLNKITLDISSKTGELNAASLEKMQSVLTRERNEFGNNIKLMLTVQDKLVGDIRLHEKNEIQQRDLIETIQRGVCSIIREFRSECVVSKDEIIAALGQLTHTQRVIEIIPFLL